MNAEPTDPVARPGVDAEVIDRVTAIMSRHPLFEALEPTSMRELAHELTPVRIEAGSIVFRQNEPGGFAYILVDGEVDIYANIPFGQVHLATVGENQVIGEIGAFSDIPRTATVMARTDLALLRLDKGSLQSVVARHPDIAFAVIGELGQRLQNMNGPLAYLTYAAMALERNEFDGQMLSALTEQSNQFGTFARAFERMAREMVTKQSRHQEMATAARIQQSIVPKGLAWPWGRPPFDIYAEMRPATDIGGDFYDYFPIGKERLGFVIADVSGKGVPASLFMAMARTVLRSVALSGGGETPLPPHECVARANRILTEQNDESMFVTLFYGVLDVKSGELAYCNAGHDEPCLLRRREDLSIERLGLAGRGIALGLSEEAEYRPSVITLNRGDTLFLYTDGVTEAFDKAGMPFGPHRLEQLLEAHSLQSSERLVRDVIASVDRYSAGAEQSDDITCLAVRYTA